MGKLMLMLLKKAVLKGSLSSQSVPSLLARSKWRLRTSISRPSGILDASLSKVPDEVPNGVSNVVPNGVCKVVMV